MKEKSFED